MSGTSLDLQHQVNDLLLITFKSMKATEEFNQFAENIFDRLKNVPFGELNSYEGREYTWRKGHQQGSIYVAIEIIFPEYKRVTVEGKLQGRIFKSQRFPYLRRFRAYESGVRIPELSG